jgi:rhodanese-related sulfurtransferase
MDNSPIPQVTPAQLVEWMQTRPALVLLDVREPHEVAYARLDDPRVVYAPLSDLASRLQEALPAAALNPQAELVVICHLGERSAQVTAWLQMQDYAHVYNLAGGLDAYAAQIDPRIRRY